MFPNSSPQISGPQAPQQMTSPLAYLQMMSQQSPSASMAPTGNTAPSIGGVTPAPSGIDMPALSMTQMLQTSPYAMFSRGQQDMQHAMQDANQRGVGTQFGNISGNMSQGPSPGSGMPQNQSMGYSGGQNSGGGGGGGGIFGPIGQGSMSPSQFGGF